MSSAATRGAKRIKREDDIMSDLLDRMRALQADHEPDGWPAVQMRDIAALVGMVEALRDSLEMTRRARLWVHGEAVSIPLDRLRMAGADDDSASEWAMLHGDSQS